MKKIGLFWFDRDLRLHDHPALSKATRSVDELICVYIHDARLNQRNRFVDGQPSRHRQQFLAEGLDDLAAKLAQLGQTLLVFAGRPTDIVASLLQQYAVTHLFRSHSAGLYEMQAAKQIERQFPAVHFVTVDTGTLFNQADLPFSLAELPTTFSQFRRAVEARSVNAPEAVIDKLPPAPKGLSQSGALVEGVIAQKSLQSIATGGESSGLTHVREYFDSNQALTYKLQRNSLSEWNHSTKFSLWLAQGSVSVREIVDQLRAFERLNTANESTYWILFELLWREYFFWYARAHGNKLFAFSGVKQKRPLTSAYAERFKRWIHGSTPFPLVNALMLELAATGYMSNRGRQIVASCLIHELSVDWRFGAAYFEQQLIDYDVGSNWGNWQYIAGVGADAREVRRFNIDKQTQQYDPDGDYRKRWLPEAEVFSTLHSMHSVDAADWPIKS